MTGGAEDPGEAVARGTESQAEAAARGTEGQAEAGARRAAGRIARNTGTRATAEFVGKFASLGMFSVLTRKTGASGLGVFVFALAWAELTVAPVDMGFDRYFLRRVARDRGELDRGFFNIVRLKLLRALAALPISWLLVWVAGYHAPTRAAVMLLSGSLLLDGLSYTVFATFNAVERGDLVGAAIAAQRLTSGGLGVGVLLLGDGVVAVTAVYLFASILALVLALTLLARQVGFPARIIPRQPRRELRRASLPFAGQELLSVGIARLDAVLLSTFGTQVVVGYYGAAYKLLEATLFIPTALQGAFAAMYTYLDRDSSPSIGAVFQRSIKLTLVLLTPAAVALELLPGPLLRLLFGGGFSSSITPLRLLAPTVVLLGVVLLGGSLVASRLNPRILLAYFAVAVVVNLALNLILIPPFGASGAAAAMLVTELIFAVLTLRVSLREVGGWDLAAVLAGPLLAGAAMAVTVALLAGTLAIALLAGVVVYGLTLIAAERRFAPGDYAFMVGAVGDRTRLWTRRQRR